MKIKYLGKNKCIDGKYVDIYYCKKLSYRIFIQSYEIYSIWRVTDDDKVVDDSTMFDFVKFNKKKNFFKIKNEEITNNNILYNIIFKIDAKGTMFDIVIEIPNVIKFDLPLENYNIFGFNSKFELNDKDYSDVREIANYLVERINSKKIKKLERRK